LSRFDFVPLLTPKLLVGALLEDIRLPSTDSAVVTPTTPHNPFLPSTTPHNPFLPSTTPHNPFLPSSSPQSSSFGVVGGGGAVSHEHRQSVSESIATFESKLRAREGKSEP
jgi:hypothetical protein